MQTNSIGGADRASILHIQRLSTEDGPGIRTTVFFKGCTLRCAWCHNPESISSAPQVHWLEMHCIGCGTCLKACPTASLCLISAGLVRDRSTCKSCGKCAEACPSGAQEVLGKTVTLEALLTELLKDRVYYEKSGGGVTLSGGEPLMQPLFSTELLRRLKEKDISTAVDTCGMCSKNAIENILPWTDLVLYDIKEIDPVRHREFTGHDNRTILDNLQIIADHISADGSTKLWVRTPLIPGATAGSETMERIGGFIHRNIENSVERWELCAFNNLCRDKYRRLGLEWQYASAPLLTQSELLDLERAAKRSGPDPAIISVTGAARVETRTQGGER